jgi:hypothetical protein
VDVFRVVLAGLVLLSGLPLGGLAGEWDPWGQFALVMGLMFAVSFVLPHYFYRGEPLLPKRRQRR